MVGNLLGKTDRILLRCLEDDLDHLLVPAYDLLHKIFVKVVEDSCVGKVLPQTGAPRLQEEKQLCHDRRERPVIFLLDASNCHPRLLLEHHDDTLTSSLVHPTQAADIVCEGVLCHPQQAKHVCCRFERPVLDGESCETRRRCLRNIFLDMKL